MLPAAEGVVPVVEEGHMLHNLHTHHSLPAIKYATPNQNKLNSFQDRMEIINKTNKMLQRAHRKN
jgi:hypothetical protein